MKKMPEASVHLRVPAVTKGRWVEASRAEGQKLGEWVTEIVEAHMSAKQPVRVAIPDDLKFSDLGLQRRGCGEVEFELSVIQRICEASGISFDALMSSHEDNVMGIVVEWYACHRRLGGDPDPTMEDYIHEVRLEDAHGQSFSLPPGRA